MMVRVEPERQPLSIRLPREIKTWLEAEAARNDRTQNSEIIRTLRARMDAEQPKRAAS
jgi:hypothetical protein